MQRVEMIVVVVVVVGISSGSGNSNGSGGGGGGGCGGRSSIASRGGNRGRELGGRWACGDASVN
ncbi:hypothetical protein BN1723_011279 [Verticillium longisporum]|uniref:Uncharacterized protein n=1 Tax=Verticillium longisporum TaxID=100787 RepID=A0A0G4L606_VERLO|nr:hypothetical protein BN1723_011279 [Verticillium longisporum]